MSEYSSEQSTSKINKEILLKEAESISIRPEDRNKDGKLLAPNGEESRLDELHWKMVRTPEFMRWFGDWANTESQNASRVVDRNGEPLLVYHGTSAQFEDFEPAHVGRNKDSGFFGTGFYFTPEERLARKYGENIKAVFLNLRNPIRFKESDMNARFRDRDSFPDAIEGRVQEIFEELKKHEDVTAAKQKLELSKSNDPYSGWTTINVASEEREHLWSRAIRKATEEAGFDGAAGENPISKLMEYTAFEPEDIFIVPNP